jgi:hypothetical protein
MSELVALDGLTPLPPGSLILSSGNQWVGFKKTACSLV